MAETQIEWTDATWGSGRWLLDRQRWLHELLCNGDGETPAGDERGYKI